MCGFVFICLCSVIYFFQVALLYRRMLCMPLCEGRCDYIQDRGATRG